MAIADVSFGQGLLFVLEFFLLFAWIWILITVLSDLFRDHETSGWAKAAWCFFLIFLPFLGVLIYLIARGGGMRERELKAQQEAKGQFDSYVREQAGAGSSAEEISKLADLKAKGVISEAEFEAQKAKLLA